MPIEKKVEVATRPKRTSRTVSADESLPPAPRRSARASSSEKSPPTSHKMSSVALTKIPEEAGKKPSTPAKNKAKDDMPTVGTPKRRGRASMNPTPAAVASPVRVTRRSVAALADEVPAVSSPRRKSRASINPSAAASPARVTRTSIAVPETEEGLEALPIRIGSRTKRKSTLVKGNSETVNEVETQKVPASSITKKEENSERSSVEKSNQVYTDSEQSSLPTAIRTPESKISTHTSPNVPSGSRSTDDKTPETKNTPSESGSADDKTPETKIPTRSGRNTPSRSGEVRTPTQSRRGSNPSTPEDSISKRSPRSISELKTSAKPSPDRHANCSSRECSPVFASRDLRRSSFSSPIRYSPRSSPSRHPRLSSGGSKEAISVETRPTSPLVCRSSSPLNSKNSHSPRSSHRHRNAAKVQEVSMPEKHCLEEENDSLMMPSKRIKRDTADVSTASSSDVEPHAKHHSPEKENGNAPKEKNTDEPKRLESSDGNSGASSRQKQKEESKAHTPDVDDSLEVDEAEVRDNSKTCLNIPGISKLPANKTSLSGLKDLEPTVVTVETSIRIHPRLTKKEDSGKCVGKPSPETSEKSVKEVVHSEKEENSSPPTKTLSLSDKKRSNKANDVVENRDKNEVSPASDRASQVVELKEESSGSLSQDDLTANDIPSTDDINEVEGHEQSVMVNSAGRTEIEKSGSVQVVGGVDELQVSEESSDVPGSKSSTIEESEVSPNKADTKGQIPNQGEGVNAEHATSKEAVAIDELPMSKENSDVPGSKSSTFNVSEVSPNKAEITDEIYSQVEEGVNDNLAASKEAVAIDELPMSEENSDVPGSKSSTFKVSEVSPNEVETTGNISNQGDGVNTELAASKEAVIVNELPVSEDNSDVTASKSSRIKELEVSSIKDETKGTFSDQVGKVDAELATSKVVVAISETSISEPCVDVSKGTTLTEDSLEVSSSESENCRNSDQGASVVNAEAPVTKEVLANIESPVSKKIIDVPKETIPTADSSLEVSCSKSEEVRISHQGELVVNSDSQNENSSDALANKELLVVSPVKPEVPLDFALDKSTIEQIVDEGYSETSDSEYTSSVVGFSDKYAKVPSIVKGLGIKETTLVIPATVPDRSVCTGKLVTGFGELENIVEDNEEACELRPIAIPNETNHNEQQSCPTIMFDDKQIRVKLDQASAKTVSDGDDPLVSSCETNTVGNELEITDQQDHPSYASPLRLAVSPEPSVNSDEDCSLSKDEAEHTFESVSVENKKVNVENIDTTTVLTKLGLKKCVEPFETKIVCEEKKNDGVLRTPQDECGLEIFDNDTTSIGDTDEEKKHDSPADKKIFCEEGKLGAPLEKCCRDIYENDTVSVGDSSEETVNVEEPVRGSDFLEYEAEEGDESDNDENIYEISDESDDSDAELLDESCFIVSEAKEQNYVANSPKLDKPVIFQVSEICHTDDTVEKNREFASAAASHFVTDRKKSAKSGTLKSHRSLSYASTAASQFVVSETASEENPEGKFSDVKPASTTSGSPPKSDSSFTSSEQEQENSKRVPKSKKRPASEAEALKEKKKFKKNLNQQPEICDVTTKSGFRVKLCNIAPKTTADELRKSLHDFDIATGLQLLEFCPRIEKHKKTAIATYDSKRYLEKALSRYGKVTVHGRRIFFLLDDETDPVCDSEPRAASPKMSPRKKFVGIISDLPKEVTIGDIISAYEQEGIKCINKVKMYKIKSSKDNLNFAKLEFSKKTALLKAIIVTENIKIQGNRVNLKIKEKP